MDMQYYKITSDMIVGFYNDYIDFMNKMNLDDNYSSRLENVNIIFTEDDGIDITYSDNNIIINKKFVNDENYKFYLYKCLLHSISTNKENNNNYSGFECDINDKKINSSFNDMVENYICNAISGVDVSDDKRVFMLFVEKLINNKDLVEMYLNNDLSKLYLSFENVGINFQGLSSKLDEFDKYRMENKTNDIGTNIYKKLATACYFNSIYDDSKLEIPDISEIVSDVGFENIPSLDTITNILKEKYSKNINNSFKSY